MAFDPISAIANVANTVLGRILPDKPAQQAAAAELMKMQLGGELAQVSGQLQIDLEEAKSQSIFVAGWRPFVGWVCGAAFAYAFVFQPFAILILKAFHSTLDPKALPALDLATMMPVLLGMLGMGVLRTIDKGNGTNNGH